MRDYYLTFVSDDVDKMRIFGALLDAGLKEFVITEHISEDVAENATTTEENATVAENAQVRRIEMVEE